METGPDRRGVQQKTVVPGPARRRASQKTSDKQSADSHNLPIPPSEVKNILGPFMDPLFSLKSMLKHSSTQLFGYFLNTLPEQTGKVSLFVPVAPFTILKSTTLPGHTYKLEDIITHDDYAKNISDEEEEKLNPILQHLRIIDERFITPGDYKRARGFYQTMLFFNCANIVINEKLRTCLEPSPRTWRNGNDVPVILFLTSGLHVFMAIFYGGIPYIFGLNVVNVGTKTMTAISVPDLLPNMDDTNIFDMCIVNETILNNLLVLVRKLKKVKIIASGYKELDEKGNDQFNIDGSLKVTYSPSNYLFYMDHAYNTFTTGLQSSYNCAKIISLIAPNRGINCTMFGFHSPAACQAQCISNKMPCTMSDIFLAYSCVYHAGIYEKEERKKEAYQFCLDNASKLLQPYYLPTTDGYWDKERHTVLEKILLRMLNPEQLRINEYPTIGEYAQMMFVDPIKGISPKFEQLKNPTGSTLGGRRKTRRSQKRKYARKTHSRRA